MKKFYVVFTDGSIFPVLADYWLPGISTVTFADGTLKTFPTYHFYDSGARIVAQFFNEHVRCITNERPEIRHS